MNLTADAIPLKVSRWLVENFDTYKWPLKLSENDELRIIEADVYLTLNFPRGSKFVDVAKKNDQGAYK